MPTNLLERDPVASFARKAVAVRRVGKNAQCVCGEARPEALIAGSNPIICAECRRKKQGKSNMDKHHYAGKPNSPITIPIPVNDHRAHLSTAQYDGPKQTRENPDGSPLLAAAASIRGFTDTARYLIEKGLLWIADMLELLHAYLAKQFGPKWWLDTDLEQFMPRGTN
jgi:hypothetical protein